MTLLDLMRNKTSLFIAHGIFFVLPFIAACSGTPIRDPYANFLRREEVERLSQAMQEEIESQLPLLEHKLINRYVNSVGQSLVAHNTQMPPLAYQFKVLRSNSINIFSIPGGVVYVSLGVLSNIEFEGQFAAAIAHELAHLDAGHALILWRERIFNTKAWAQSFSQRTKDDFHSHYFGAKGLLAYGDTYEYEADEIAMVLIYQAGYDPRAYIAYLTELEKIHAKKPDLLKDLFSLHPPITERIRRAQEYVRLLPPKRESRLTSASFKEIKQRLRIADKMKTKEKIKVPKETGEGE